MSDNPTLRKIDYIQSLFGWKSKQPVYNLMKDEALPLPYLKINGVPYFEEGAVIQWLKDKTIRGENGKSK